MKKETCDVNNPRLVSFEVTPIHYLFHPFLQVKKDFAAGGEEMDKEKFFKITNNMHYLFTEFQYALDPNLFVVTGLESFKLGKAEAKEKDFLKIKRKTLIKIYKNYQQTRNKYFYQEDIFINKKKNSGCDNARLRKI